jgi:CheY-like chemotaxis protein
VKLFVSDSGTGMPPSVASKIFDPFFSTKAPGKGTGLGLSTVAMIVDGLGGAIDLETGEGKGRTFSIYLPAITETADEKSAAPNELRRAGAGRRVLIADDEVAVAAIMREMLESAGYRARTAASGLEALAVAEEMQPDLAVLDLMMPGANGGEVFFDLRERFPEMPIVLISGLSAEQAEVEVPQAAAFLEKPFSHIQLLETIPRGSLVVRRFSRRRGNVARHHFHTAAKSRRDGSRGRRTPHNFASLFAASAGPRPRLAPPFRRTRRGLGGREIFRRSATDLSRRSAFA